MTIAEQIRHQGDIEGRLEAKARTLLRQLKLRYGTLGQAAVRRVETASADQLDLWLERVIAAQSIEDVFEA